MKYMIILGVLIASMVILGSFYIYRGGIGGSILNKVPLDESPRLPDGEELGAVGDISSDIIGHPVINHEPVPEEGLPETALPLVDMPRVQLVR